MTSLAGVPVPEQFAADVDAALDGSTIPTLCGIPSGGLTARITQAQADAHGEIEDATCDEHELRDISPHEFRRAVREADPDAVVVVSGTAAFDCNLNDLNPPDIRYRATLVNSRAGAADFRAESLAGLLGKLLTKLHG